jgi:hypothetical protein
VFAPTDGHERPGCGSARAELGKTRMIPRVSPLLGYCIVRKMQANYNDHRADSKRKQIVSALLLSDHYCSHEGIGVSSEELGR